MTTAIRWSYDRLTADAQLVCDRLALFERGFTIEAVEAVCPDVPERHRGARHRSSTRGSSGRWRAAPTSASWCWARSGPSPANGCWSAPTWCAAASSWPPTWPSAPRRPDPALRRRRGPRRWLASTTTPPTSPPRSTGRSSPGAGPSPSSSCWPALDCWVATGRHNEALGLTVRVLHHVPQQGPEAARLLAAATLLSHLLSDHDQTMALRSDGPGARRATRRPASRPPRPAPSSAPTLVLSGQTDEGVALAEAAAAEAEALDLYPLSTQALTVLAMALAFGGDVDGERRAHEAQLAIVRAKGDLARTADVLNTLAEIALDDADGETARTPSPSEALGDRASSGCRPSAATPRSPWRALPSSGDLSPRRAPARRGAGPERPAGPDARRGPVPARRRLPGRGAGRGRHGGPAVRGRAGLSPSPGGGDVPPEQDLAATLAEARSSLGEQAARRAWTLGSGLPARRRSAAQLAELLGRVSSPA